MANETPVTVVGNATADAELRYTPQGAAVASVTVASTPRKFNSATKQWEDQEALFLRCTVWRDQAEHVGETVTRGMRLVVTGSLVQRSFTDREGNARTVVEIQAEEVAPSLKFASAAVRKAERAAAAPAGDPWGSAPNTDDAPF